jgi:hypothetical protein
LSWDQAVRAVIQSKAAFTAMGDWTYGELAKAGLKEKRSISGRERSSLLVEKVEGVPARQEDSATTLQSQGGVYARQRQAEFACRFWTIEGVGTKFSVRVGARNFVRFRERRAIS